MAGLIPQDFIDDLLQRVDVVDVVDARVPLKKAGKNFSACCPFHNEKTPSFTVSPDKQFYHCFGCGAHGNALRFLIEYDRLEFVEAVEELAKSVGMEVPRQQSNAPKAQPGLSDAMEKASHLYQDWLKTHPSRTPAVDYLKQRGLSGEIAKRFQLGLAPEGWSNLLDALKGFTPEQLDEAGLTVTNEKGRTYDRFRQRIMYPIRNRRGKTIAFGGRAIGDEKPKYLNSPETPLFHKNQEIYGLYEATDSGQKPSQFVVVEGYMDVIALFQFGIEYAVATLGTATSQTHVEKLLRYSKKIIFCFDGDQAGKTAAWRALENALPALKGDEELSFLFLPEGEDPDTQVRAVGKDAFEEQLASAEPLSSFFYRHLSEGLDLSVMEHRSKLVNLAKPLLEKIPAGAFRSLMEQELKNLTHIETAITHGAPGSRHRQPRQAQQRITPESAQSLTTWPIARLALTMVIQHPQLQHTVPTEFDPTEFDDPSLNLMGELLDYLQDHPNAHTGQLLEAFKLHPYADRLNELAVKNLVIDTKEALEAEFASCIKQILQRFSERRLNYLKQKLKTEGLSPKETLEWQNLLLQSKHQQSQ